MQGERDIVPMKRGRKRSAKKTTSKRRRKEKRRENREGGGGRSSHAVVTRVTIYPIKSCGGTEVETCRLVRTGLEGDRVYMVVDEKNGRFVTQRNCPRMALIRPQLKRKSGTIIGVRLMGLNEKRIVNCEIVKHKKCSVTLWKDTLNAFDQGDEAAEWLSTFLNRKVRLVYVGDERRAVADKEMFAVAPGKDSVSFSVC